MLTTAAKSLRPNALAARVGITVAQDVARNTSTPKCPDSTSAKKPFSSKEPVPKEQDKSPVSRGSCKCSHSTSRLPSQMDVSRKRPTQKTHMNSTPPSPLAPVGLMVSTVRQDPTVRQLSSISLTPLGLGTP